MLSLLLQGPWLRTTAWVAGNNHFCTVPLCDYSGENWEMEGSGTTTSSDD